jgi:lipoprotein-anchoring transpeptidase ErfK/SrfK
MRKFGLIFSALIVIAGPVQITPVSAAKVATAQTETTKKTRKKAPAALHTDARQCRSFLECLFSKKSGRVRSGDNFFRGSSREVVNWDDAKYKPGSIIIRTPERALYYVMSDGRAMRYRVGVGREGFQWSGVSRIVNKAEWPDWRPPKVMIEREAAKGNIIPEFMEGGPENPLGARAMYIGGTLFRIHGTNNAASIGGAVSSGCIRMLNADVIDLYERVRIGARVYVYQ